MLARRLIKSACKFTLGNFNRFATVSGDVVNITFVDSDGNRATVKGRIGRTLVEAAIQHKVDISYPCCGGGTPVAVKRTEQWTETLFGEGPTCFLCHVQIPPQYHHLLPDKGVNDDKGLYDRWKDEANNTSFLACQIVLEKKHEGMVVFVPDAQPEDPL